MIGNLRGSRAADDGPRAVELSVAMRMGGTLSKRPSLMICLTIRQKNGIVLENANPQTGSRHKGIGYFRHRKGEASQRRSMIKPSL